MELKRFFVENNIINNQIVLTDVEHNHLSNVLRLRVGDNVICVVGDGYDYECEIVSIDKKSSTLKVLSKIENIYDPKVNITVYQGVIKGDNMPLITQKLNEIGVTKLVPFTSKYTVALGSKNLVGKLQATSNQSVKQCNRSKPMIVSDIRDIKDIPNDFGSYDKVLLCYEKESATMQSLENALVKANNIAIIVGSEGGFSNEEVDYLVSKGATSISMGNRILRAETACISISSVVAYIAGEWNR